MVDQPELIQCRMCNAYRRMFIVLGLGHVLYDLDRQEEPTYQDVLRSGLEAVNRAQAAREMLLSDSSKPDASGD